MVRKSVSQRWPRLDKTEKIAVQATFHVEPSDWLSAFALNHLLVPLHLTPPATWKLAQLHVIESTFHSSHKTRLQYINRNMHRSIPHPPQLNDQSMPLMRPTDWSANWEKSEGVISRSFPTHALQRSVTTA